MAIKTESDLVSLQKQSYNDISTIYEKEMTSHHVHLQTILDRLTSTFLKPHSNILDIGSGTGKPVSAHFAHNGHNVTGIDFSPAMLELARKQVPNATFIQAEVTSWEPPISGSYDLVVESHVFYNLSVAQTRTMIYKIAQWVKKDGFIVIGSSYCLEELEKTGVQFDHRGWTEESTNIFLDRPFGDGTIGREEAWVNLLTEAGLEVIDVDIASCPRQNSPLLDVQFYIIAKRVQDNHLIGPFPIPDTFNGPVTPQPDAWAELKERLELGNITQTAIEAFRKEPSCLKVLHLGESGPTLQLPNTLGIELQHISGFPSSDIQPGSFNGVLLYWVLHLVSSPGDYLDQALRAITPTGNARVVIIQAAPDNEFINLMNAVSQELNLPVQHHGYVLKEAEAKLRAAGFQTVNYIRTQGSINFGSVKAEERVDAAASLVARILTTDKAIQAQIVEHIKKLLKLRFVFKLSGKILTHTIVLVAQRD